MQQQPKHWARLVLALSLVLALAVTLVAPAAAADFRSGDTVVIGANEVIDDDLFITANSVTINGTVNGNLFIASSQIEMNGTVNGSLFVGGDALRLNGTVTGSLYGGGTAFALGPRAVVGRNAMFGGYAFRSDEGSRIGRDLLVGAYQAQLGGTVSRDVRIGANAVELNGTIERNVEVGVGETNTDFWTYTPFYRSATMPAPIAPGLRVNTRSIIRGQLTYYSSADQTSGIAAAPAGGVVFRQTEPPRTAPVVTRASDWLADQVREFLTLLVLGLLAVWLLPKRLNTVVDNAQAKPLAAALWGVLIVFGGFALALVAFVVILLAAIWLGVITLGGLAWVVFSVGLSALALAFAGFMLLLTYGAELVVAYLIGKLLLQQVAASYATQRLWVMLVGLIVYALLTAIPFLGGIVHVVATLIGLGAIAYALRGQRLRAPTPVAVAV